MKIVFLNDLIYAYAAGASSAFGGAERQQWFLARGLARAGWQVTVGVREGLERGGRFIDGVKFGHLEPGQVLRSWHRFLTAERADWWYWRCASHLLGPAVTIAKLAGARMIFASGFDRDLQPRGALYRRPFMWPLYWYGLARADRIFVQHEDQFAVLPQRWHKKAAVIPSIAQRAAKIRDHERRENYVAWVAMLRQFKRPDLLIEIAHRLPDIRFVVCGGVTTFMSPDGYGQRVMDRLHALPNVDYRGQVSPAEAMKVVSRAALFLSTSDEEGFPNTFLQAWGGGTPVISLGIDPGRAIERHGLGLTAPNIEEAAAAIRSLIKSPARRQTIAARAHQYVAEHHGEAAVIRAFEHALEVDHKRPAAVSRSAKEERREEDSLQPLPPPQEGQHPGREPLA
jgi:glycosyltransferase involved in cell wall biosynthesis